MHHDGNCACDHRKLEDSSRQAVEDCPSCGALTWSGTGSPPELQGEPLTCSACGGRVVAWTGEHGVTTLRRCLSCDEVVALTL